MPLYGIQGQDIRISFTIEKPCVSLFHVFGCPIYIHVYDEKIIKLEPSSIKGIFLGYYETYKAYYICILV